MATAPELKCFCINLDSRPDKWASTQAAFAGTGIKLERFPAIKHEQGWRGCGASHVAIAREAARQGLPWVLVVEDDCQPMPGAASRLPALREALWATRGNWDIFLGGPTFVEGPARTLSQSGGLLLEIEQAFALHFYILHAGAYEKAAAWDADRDGPIDVYYSGALRLVTAGAPHLAVQRPSTSDIKREVVDYGREFRNSERRLLALAHVDRTRDFTVGLVVLSGAALAYLWFGWKPRRR